MKGSIYKLGMVLESKKNKYRVEIVQIDKELINGRPPKYTYRVKELQEMKNALNIFMTKIKFTYEPIPSTFLYISEKVEGNVSKIFKNATEEMENKPAGEAWDKSLDAIVTNMKKEDIDIIRNLGRLLGKTDIEGQISEIKLVNNFLDIQIKDAEEEKNKNEKMYRTLGIVAGMTITILLI